MTTLLTQTYARTLTHLIDEIAEYKQHKIEVWLFEAQHDRAKIESALIKQGFNLKIYSAYKPLVTFFLDERNDHDYQSLTIEYPIFEGAPEKRFLLECYPLTGCFPNTNIEFKAQTEKTQDPNQLFYQIRAVTPKGEIKQWSIFAPNRFETDFLGQMCLSQTGWIKITDKNQDKQPTIALDMNAIKNQPLMTEFELIFKEAMDAIERDATTTLTQLEQNNQLSKRPLFFEQLKIDLTLPMTDTSLEFGQEIISFQELLHEEFYFSILELLEKLTKPVIGSVDMRTLQTGQIIPAISYQDGPINLTITKQSFDLNVIDKIAIQNDHMTTQVSIDQVATIKTPPTLSQIESLLSEIPGASVCAQSVLGQTILGKYIEGEDRPVLMSGAQHANETSGTLGVLGAAKNLLDGHESSHFVVVPVENPDGYQLHQQFMTISPWHIHHAARYSALGDDLEYRQIEPLYEKSMRYTAIEHVKHVAGKSIDLHINMHGYPSHEWTRPLTGYIPRGFAMWTIPKGLFLIVRHHKNWAKQARALIELVAQDIAKDEQIMAFNSKQIEQYQIYAGDVGFETIHGVACLISEDERSPFPVTVITEYPDETLQGNAFIDAHRTQKITCQSIYQNWQVISELC